MALAAVLLFCRVTFSYKGVDESSKSLISLSFRAWLALKRFAYVLM